MVYNAPGTGSTKMKNQQKGEGPPAAFRDGDKVATEDIKKKKTMASFFLFRLIKRKKEIIKIWIDKYK